MIKTITTGALLAAAALLVTPTANADPTVRLGRDRLLDDHRQGNHSYNAASQLDGMNHAMASCNKLPGTTAVRW